MRPPRTQATVPFACLSLMTTDGRSLRSSTACRSVLRLDALPSLHSTLRKMVGWPLLRIAASLMVVAVCQQHLLIVIKAGANSTVAYLQPQWPSRRRVVGRAGGRRREEGIHGVSPHRSLTAGLYSVHSTHNWFAASMHGK